MNSPAGVADTAVSNDENVYGVESKNNLDALIPALINYCRTHADEALPQPPRNCWSSDGSVPCCRLLL
jgi:hypothetical protein